MDAKIVYKWAIFHCFLKKYFMIGGAEYARHPDAWQTPRKMSKVMSFESTNFWRKLAASCYEHSSSGFTL